MTKLSCQDLELFWVSKGSREYPAARRPVVPAYRVGEPFQRGRRQWPVGTQYSHGSFGHELTIFLDEIHDRVIHDVRQEEAEFALVVQHPVMLLAFRFGQSVPWTDVPFCIHMHPVHCRTVPAQILSTETRALLWITLVGAHDGIIHAQRGMTLAPEFTRVLHTAIRDQANSSFCPEECLQAVGDLLLAYPDTEARLAMAQVRTVGNL